MKTKIILGSVFLILLLGIAAGAYWWLSRPQVITFSDDAKVTFPLRPARAANVVLAQHGRRACG